jgi:hypothetical protein
MDISDNYFQFGKAGSTAIYCEYATQTITGNLIQSSDTGVTGAIQLKNVNGFHYIFRSFALFLNLP